ncbi:MAG: hypothetical protein ACUVRU_08485 [Anaerolineae bacterium]
MAEQAWLRYLQSQSIACRLWRDVWGFGEGDEHQPPFAGFVAQPDVAELLASATFAEIVRRAWSGERFPSGFFPACERRGIFGFDIKSSRVSPRHLAGGQVNYVAILEDDFLVHPPMGVDGSDELNRWDIISQKQRVAAAERTPYLLIRTYVNPCNPAARSPKTACAAWRVYLIGYITRPLFFQSRHLRITMMPQTGKEERATCYAVPLRLGQSLSGLRQALGL